MTRFYALSNFVETVLFSLFILNPLLRTEFYRTVRDPIIACLMTFFAWVLFSGLWSSASIPDILENWWSWRKVLLLPIGLILLQSRWSYSVGLKTFVAVGLFFFFCSVAMLALGVGEFWGRPYTHILQNHNSQGVYFSIVGLILVLLGQARIRSSNALAFLQITLGFSLVFFVLWFGSSRSGYVSSIIVLGLGCFSIFNRKPLGLLLGICVALGLIFSSPQASSRVGQAVTEMQVGAQQEGGDSTSGSIRIVMWLNTVQLLKHNWLLGTGAGGFSSAYQKIVEDQDTSEWRKTLTDDPHQQFLHIWSTYGLPGLLIYLSFLGCIFFRFLGQGKQGLLSVALISIIVSVGFFNGVIGASVEGRTILLALALTFCMKSNTNRTMVNDGC